MADDIKKRLLRKNKVARHRNVFVNPDGLEAADRIGLLEREINTREAERARLIGRIDERDARIAELEGENERLRADLDDANSSVIAFGAIRAVEYAKSIGLPKDHLDPVHYDILEKAGARMDDFTRAALNQEARRG